MEALDCWFRIARTVNWKHFTEVRRTYSSADQVSVASGNTVTVFNVGGNKVRLVTAIHFNTQTVYILRVLTHQEYDKEAWKRRL